MMFVRGFLAFISIAAVCSLNTISFSQDDAGNSGGPWISSCIWLSDSEIAGTKSQGLLRRPAQVVKAEAESPTEMETLGEAELSLWSLLAVDGGRYIASDYGGSIHVFGMDQPEQIDTEETKWIRALSVTPDADKFLAGDEEGQLIEFSLENNQETRRIGAHAAAIFDISFSPDGKLLATACADGSLKVFHWPDLSEAAQMSRGSDSMWAVLFTADGNQLVSGGGTDNRRIQLWDLESAQSICTICRTRDWITDLIRVPDSSLVIASCMDGKLVVADTKTRLKVGELQAAESAIWSIDLSPDGQRLVLGTRKHGFQIVTLPDWKSAAESLAAQAAELRPPSPVN